MTLGCRDLPRLRAFCAAFGWRELDGGDDGFAQFDVGGTRLALFPGHLLGEEAAPGEQLPRPGTGPA